MNQMTFCLNEETASDRTYQNWVTIRATRDANGTYVLERLTNCDGNGQRWDVCGYGVSGNVSLFCNGSKEERIQMRIVAAHMRRKGWTVNDTALANVPSAGGKHTVGLRPVGRKTAAPTLLGRNRDKNRNRMREKVATIDFAAEMARRKAR